LYHHTITFRSPRDFGQFCHEVGSDTWFKELGFVFHDGQIDTESGRYLVAYRSETAIDKETQIDIQGAPWIADTAFNSTDDAVPSTQEEEGDEIVPLDSQLGQDAAALVAHYFPGSTITGIQHNYYHGVFIGDFSIEMTCAVSHPFLQQVVISFNNQDVPGRPDSWQKLCSLHIDLFITSFTLINPASDRPITYETPGMYQEELKKWWGKHDDGMLYGRVETLDMFIITTELFSHSHEEVEQTAKLLAVQAKAKLEREMHELAESPKVENLVFDDPLSDLEDHPF